MIPGDLLTTYAQMDSAGLTVTFVSSIDPNGAPLDGARLGWDDLGGGLYRVTYQTTGDDPLGQYQVWFRFDDIYGTDWSEMWALGAVQVIYPATAPPFQTGTPQNVAPHRRDIDDTHDSQYYLRGEETIPGPHVHMDAGVVASFADTDSIDFTLAGSVISADAKFGTTAGTVAEGSELASKLGVPDVAALALTGQWVDILGKPSSFAPAPHNQDGSTITTGTIPVARLPTGTSGSQVAWGNHGHAWVDNWNIPLGYAGGPAIPATTAYLDMVVPANIQLSGNWTIVAMGPSGAIQLDLWLQTYASFPPLVANTIIGGGGTKPRILATSNKGQGTYAGWATTLLTAGSVLRIYVDSCTTIQQVTLSLEHIRVV